MLRILLRKPLVKDHVRQRRRNEVRGEVELSYIVLAISTVEIWSAPTAPSCHGATSTTSLESHGHFSSLNMSLSPWLCYPGRQAEVIENIRSTRTSPRGCLVPGVDTLDRVDDTLDGVVGILWHGSGSLQGYSRIINGGIPRPAAPLRIIV